MQFRRLESRLLHDFGERVMDIDARTRSLSDQHMEQYENAQAGM